MWTKLKTHLENLPKQFLGKPSKRIMRWILWYIMIIIISTLFYLCGWCMEWWVTGKPDLQELRAFLHEIVSSPWIAMVGFIGQLFVDKDHNKVPDILEKDTPLLPKAPSPYLERRNDRNDTR